MLDHYQRTAEQQDTLPEHCICSVELALKAIRSWSAREGHLQAPACMADALGRGMTMLQL